MRFRKNPVVIDAEQFDWSKEWDNNVEEITNLANNLGVEWECLYEESGSAKDYRNYEFCIETLEGPHQVIKGDWIITGIKGEKYACKPDIFDLTYSLVDESALPSPTVPPIA